MSEQLISWKILRVYIYSGTSTLCIHVRKCREVVNRVGQQENPILFQDVPIREVPLQDDGYFSQATA